MALIMSTDQVTKNYQELIDCFEDQSDAGKKLGFSQPTISDLYNGKKFMSAKSAMRVADIKGVKFKAHDLARDLFKYHQSTKRSET